MEKLDTVAEALRLALLKVCRLADLLSRTTGLHELERTAYVHAVQTLAGEIERDLAKLENLYRVRGRLEKEGQS